MTKSVAPPREVGSMAQLPPREERTYHKITFSKGDKNADQTVFVGLNGSFFRYPRGVRCMVPLEVIGVLNDAIQRNIDTTDGTATIETEEQAYTFQDHGTATSDEVAAYFAQ